MLSIEIVSDFVCPWCFIGLRRLSTAIGQVRRENPEFAFVARWRPFFLNPHTPPEGEPYLPFLERKFGGREKVEALFARVREAGRAHRVDFAFEKIALRANTLRAHRLVHWAQQQGDAAALVECGYDAAAARRYLESDADVDVVRADEQAAHRLGINMVPSFIVGGRHIVVGAEDPSILVAAILSHRPVA